MCGLATDMSGMTAYQHCPGEGKPDVVESVREVARAVDAGAAALEERVDVLRAANEALSARGSELTTRSERLRVAGKMLEKQASSVTAKGELLAREREALRREHARLQANRDKLALVARKLKVSAQSRCLPLYLSLSYHY